MAKYNKGDKIRVLVDFPPYYNKGDIFEIIYESDDNVTFADNKNVVCTFSAIREGTNFEMYQEPTKVFIQNGAVTFPDPSKYFRTGWEVIGGGSITAYKKPIGCSHELKTYIGLNKKCEFCTKCNEEFNHRGIYD